MGIAALDNFLGRHRRIAIDTSILIYHLEQPNSYSEIVREIFTWLEIQAHTAVTSTLTLTELVVQPYRAGDEMLVNKYYALLSTFPKLEWAGADLQIADTAARLRAQHRLRTPDALQAATGICRGATALITDLARVEQLDVCVLNRLVS